MNDLESLFGALAGVPRLEGALCIAMWDVFDSLEDADVELAISICDRCPCIEACAAWADSLPRYHFEGVVAGKPRRPKPKPKPAAVPA